MKYLVIDSEGVSQIEAIDDDLRIMVNDGEGDVIRFEQGEFQKLVVDGDENDDGDMEWNDDRWTKV